ncbi:MAG TPA: SIS domain-containing protein [Solirubrobacteraceae bacterium]|nr:SIS domain-containing protein [Solirubrobacteraceae bacterium]
MSSLRSASGTRELLEDRLEQRRAAGTAFFGSESERIARLCHRMAERFARGGRLIAAGLSPAARSDVRHVAVEFVHPVIVGKRALPALGLAGESGALVRELELTVEPDDIVIAFGEPSEGSQLRDGVATARAHGCLTIAFSELGAEFVLEPPSLNEFVRQELVETTYHVLWELVHVFFEHRGLLEGRTERRSHDAGASSFLYPFLAEREDDLDAVLADVRASVLMKADEVHELRVATLHGATSVLADAAAATRDRLNDGGRLLALGNGGSATDAADVVADFVAPPAQFGWPSRRAIDLVADTAIITAIANDIGTEAIFARQVIAHGRAGDVLLALSTSGNSLSVLDALAEARRRQLVTIALVGYDGGRVAAEQLADHIVVTPSQHIPRIQEAQATAYHVLRELVELG